MANLHGTISSAATISGQVGVIAIDGYTIVLSKPTSTTYKMTCTKGTTVKTLTWKDGAKGDTGKGISSAVLNNDYTLTLTFTDGTSYTTPSIRGAAGSDASVTAENIATALGYTPANQTALAGKQDVIEDLETIRSKANSALQQHQDISGKQDVIPDLATIRSKANSALQTETDPTVPSWAKAESKPSYSASEIAYGDTNVGAALTEQNSDIVQKLTEPSTGLAVGKYFRVSAIDENGHAVLEACDLPKATTTSLGLVQADASNGIYVNSNGVISINRCDTGEIYRRATNKPVTPISLDYAVKSAMCDGIGAAWSSAEQSAARQRLGMERKKVFEATITEETSVSTFTFSISEPCNRVMIFISCRQSDGVHAIRIYPRNSTTGAYLQQANATRADGNKHNTYSLEMLDGTTGMWFGETATGNYVDGISGGINKVITNYSGYAIDNLQNFTVSVLSSGVLPVGSSIVAYKLA